MNERQIEATARAALAALAGGGEHEDWTAGTARAVASAEPDVPSEP